MQMEKPFLYQKTYYSMYLNAKLTTKNTLNKYIMHFNYIEFSKLFWGYPDLAKHLRGDSGSYGQVFRGGGHPDLDSVKPESFHPITIS